jgi:hypothetical protein
MSPVDSGSTKLGEFVECDRSILFIFKEVSDRSLWDADTFVRDSVPGAVRFPMNFINGGLCCVAVCAAATCRRTFVVFMLCPYVKWVALVTVNISVEQHQKAWAVN